MTPELDAKLCRDFPSLYRNRHGDMRETAMCWGFEHCGGWYQIIRNLSRVIDNYCKNNGTACVVDQVKEKYGTLRFYYHLHLAEGGTNDDAHAFIDGAVSMAYAMSAVTCEICGKPGKQRGSRWIVTRCDGCRATGKAAPKARAKEHCCGLTGFDPMKGDNCPACDEMWENL